MKLFSIASGSKGNCVYVGSSGANILVDAGISRKRIVEGLALIDILSEDLDAILITHEHSDHVAGLGVMSRKFNVPIYGTEETLDKIKNNKTLGKINPELFNIINPDEGFMIADLKLTPFSTFHDASNPVAYTLETEDKKVGIATDLGKYNDYIIENLENCDILFIEANHDENMLMVGDYPYYLKQRILSENGHLSNESSASLICKLISHKVKHVILAHLSNDNNFDDLAYETVLSQLKIMECDLSNLTINVAKKEAPSELIVI